MQESGDKEYDVAIRILDLIRAKSFLPGSPLSVKVNRTMVTILIVKPAYTLPDHGIERRSSAAYNSDPDHRKQFT